MYDEILIFDESNLNSEFRIRFENKLKPNVRGFGYWVWKPQIISQVLLEASAGDVVHYIDVGCHLNYSGKSRLLEYFSLANACATGILAFEAFPPSSPFPIANIQIPRWVDADWTKGDLIKFLDVQNDSSVLQRPTIQSGTFFMRKQDSTVNFTERWGAVFEADFSLADDSPSRAPNLPSFIEHRHDQAIFSLLAKRENACTLSASEFWYPIREGATDAKYGDWKRLSNYPIHAKRDLDFGPFRNFQRSIVKQYEYWKRNFLCRLEP